MAYQRVPFTAEFRTIFNIDGTDIMNVYHANRGIAYSQGELDSLTASIDSLAGGLATDLSTADAYIRTDARGLNSESDLSASSSLGATAGSVTATRTMPLNVAFCIARLSGFSGRSARGRVYIAGVPTVHMNGTIDSQSYVLVAWASAMTAHVDGIRSFIDGTGIWEPVIVSRYNNLTKRTEAVTTKWISTAYRTLKVATRRRRLR